MNLALSSNHNGVYDAYTFPASQQYKDMGQKAKNERKIYSGMTYHTGSGKYWLDFSSSCPFNECSGDLIKVYDASHVGIFILRIQLSEVICTSSLLFALAPQAYPEHQLFQ